MTDKTKKTALFTEEEIKKLLELGFEPNCEGGKARKPCNIKSFWKNYFDPKDDEENWQMCIDTTAKAGVFQVNYWAWRYPPTEKNIKGFKNLLDYLSDGDFVDSEYWNKQYVASQLVSKGKKSKKTVSQKLIKQYESKIK
jgi:hypothetical protein